MKKLSTTLSRLSIDLVPVLEELRMADIGRRPFVVVDEPLTKRFVQFGRLINPGPGQAPRGEMGFDVSALHIALQGFGNDPVEGARMAAETLRVWLPEEAELVITIDGNETN